MIMNKALGKSESLNEYTSCDAPPLDFTFKNIKHLEQLLTMAPRQGVRKDIIVQVEQSKDKKAGPKQQTPSSKEVSKEEENVEVDKKVTKKASDIIRLVPQNNINTLISTIVSNSNMKNVTGKNSQDPNLEKKKAIQVKLECLSLILGYNKLRSVSTLHTVMSQVMPNFSRIQWLDLSHNYLETLDYDFAGTPDLRTLYLHCNYLYDMSNLQTLGKLCNLKTLTIHGNPITAIPNFRIYIIGMLPELKKLDSVVISKKQRDNSRVWVKTGAQKFKFPVLKQYARPPVEDQEKNETDFQ